MYVFEKTCFFFSESNHLFFFSSESNHLYAKRLKAVSLCEMLSQNKRLKLVSSVKTIGLKEKLNGEGDSVVHTRSKNTRNSILTDNSFQTTRGTIKSLSKTQPGEWDYHSIWRKHTAEQPSGCKWRRGWGSMASRVSIVLPRTSFTLTDLRWTFRTQKSHGNSFTAQGN